MSAYLLQSRTCQPFSSTGLLAARELEGKFGHAVSVRDNQISEPDDVHANDYVWTARESRSIRAQDANPGWKEYGDVVNRRFLDIRSRAVEAMSDRFQPAFINNRLRNQAQLRACIPHGLEGESLWRRILRWVVVLGNFASDQQLARVLAKHLRKRLCQFVVHGAGVYA